jgi:hypothetical protein
VDDVLHCGTDYDKADGGAGSDIFFNATHGCEAFTNIP